ncbi:MAG: hypothetical protein JST89_20670 [Cyanobacteria bacterium SZAS-4]|nr:hypothetical protein [Cyanobacteria bacterium SZAS-4]
MKLIRDLAVTALLLVAVFKLVSLAPGESHTDNTANNLQQTLSNGVAAPSMRKGYSCDLGELGRLNSYENKKRFWGDDGISQGFQGASDAAGRSLGKIGVSF